LKPTTLEAAMLILTVVPGLTPTRALRVRTVKAPKPANLTASPFAKAPVKAPKTTSSTFSASFLLWPVSLATTSTNYTLFIYIPPRPFCYQSSIAT